MTIENDIKQGRVIGPFTRQPFTSFIGSPMGAFKKRSSQKFRLIQDLSWPAGKSVNDFIDKAENSLTYITVDTIVQGLQKSGIGSYIAKMDLAHLDLFAKRTGRY